MKRILIRLGIVVSLPFFIFIVFVLFPGLLYGNTAGFGNVTVYSNGPIPIGIAETLNESVSLVRGSELFDPNWEIQVCLSEGLYPKLVAKIQGPAFGYGFANKVVLNSALDWEKNYAELNGRKWQLSELIAHEMLHSFQYRVDGFATLRTPIWKLEGYPEVIARSGSAIARLAKSIEVLERARNLPDFHQWTWIELDNGTGIPAAYLRYKILVQYMMETEGLSYREVLSDERTAEQVEELIFIEEQSTKF